MCSCGEGVSAGKSEVWTCSGRQVEFARHRKSVAVFFPLQFQRGIVPKCVCMFIRVQLVVTPWTVALQAALSMGIFGQEYWSGLPFTPLGDLPDLGIEPVSLGLKTDSLSLNHLGRSFVPTVVNQLLNGIQLFATPWIVAYQASLSFSISQSLLLSIESVMPFTRPLLSPSPSAFNLSQHQGLIQGVVSSHQVARVLELQLQHQSFQ